MSFGFPSGRTRNFTGDSRRRLPHILKLKADEAGEAPEDRGLETRPRLSCPGQLEDPITSLLGVLEGNNAGFRKLPRQILDGLEVPHCTDVARRRAHPDDMAFS